MMNFRKIISGLLLLSMVIGSAQNNVFEGDPDASFKTARTLAFSGNRVEARDTLHHILTKYPEYADVRNLLAKTYSWDGDYHQARLEFNKITSLERNNKEVRVAAINNEFYAKNYATALGLSNKALQYLESDEELKAMQEKAQAYIYAEASGDTAEETKKTLNTFRVDNAIDVFDAIFDPVFYGSLSYERVTKYGKVIPRINYSNRLEITGVQYEIDAYPIFSEKIYGYVNYGYSDDLTFPNHRIGAELYTNLPKALEASAGVRYLDFRESTALVFTGSLGMYKGDYYFSLRPYLTPGNTADPLNLSGLLLARRYLKDANNYLEVNQKFNNSL